MFAVIGVPCHYDAHMARDWSRQGLDRERFGVQRPVFPATLIGAPPSRRLQLGQLGLVGKCLLAGVMAALLYIWPALMATYILSGGFPSVVFWSILAGGVVAFSVAFWAINRLEDRYWAHNWHTVSDWVDEQPWK